MNKESLQLVLTSIFRGMGQSLYSAHEKKSTKQEIETLYNETWGEETGPLKFLNWKNEYFVVNTARVGDFIFTVSDLYVESWKRVKVYHIDDLEGFEKASFQLEAEELCKDFKKYCKEIHKEDFWEVGPYLVEISLNMLTLRYHLTNGFEGVDPSIKVLVQGWY